MKKFNVKFSTCVLIMLILVVLIFIGGAVLSIMQFLKIVDQPLFSKYLYALVVLIDIALLVFSISIFFSRYVIKNSTICFYLGFIKTIYNIEDIVEINHFKKSNKLVVYFNDEKFTVIIISPKKYDDFTLSIREKNKKIIFDETIEKED